MNILIILPLFIALVFCIGYFGIYRIALSAQKTHEKLRCLKEEVMQASSETELRELHSKLIIIANEECWHKSFLPMIYEIKGLILGKTHHLKNGKES